MAGYGSGGGYRRSDPARQRVGLFVDLENLKAGAREGSGTLDVGELASRVMEMAREEGRVIHAAAYADWTARGSEPREFRRLQMETKLVVCEEENDPKCWLPMSLDVLETLYQEPRIDVYVICGGARELEEVVRRLRRGDRKVVLCAGGYSCSQDLVQVADRFARIEELLGPGGMDGEGCVDFDRYDWGPFVRALDWHEKRMEFIGIGLLLKKILDHRNCGYTSYNRKREIFERAKEMGIIEIYTVPNIDAGGDPVSACRLCRDHEEVGIIIGSEDPPREEEAEGIGNSDAVGNEDSQSGEDG